MGLEATLGHLCFFFPWASLLSCSQALFFPLTLHYKGKEGYPTQIKWLLYIENSHRFIVPCSSLGKRIFNLETYLWFFSSFEKVNVFNWRLITLQYCSGFCHTLTWISHGCTCVPHPEPPSHLPPHPSLWVIPVHQPWAPCLMHQTWTGNLCHIW